MYQLNYSKKISTAEDMFIYKKNWANPASFLFSFSLFQTNISIFTTIFCENFHPDYGAGTGTHDIQIASLIP